MKKTILFATIALIVASSVSAQDSDGYKRPRGCFYVPYTTFVKDDGTTDFEGNFAPYISCDPYSTVKFVSNIQGAPSYSWIYNTENPATSAIIEGTANTPDLEFEMGFRTCPSPLLTANGTDYQLKGYDKKNGAEYVCKLIGAPNYDGIYDVNYSRHAWSSSKYFGNKTNRDGSKGTGTYSWGLGGSGQLFGKNTHARNFSGLATAFEAPVNPYLIRSLGVYVSKFDLTDPYNGSVDLTMTVYKVDAIPEYEDGVSVEIVPGEALASKTITVNDAYLNANMQWSSTNYYNGFLVFPLDEMLKVDSDILVTFTGYNVDAVSSMTAYSTCDYYDEGYGELGYIYDGSAEKWVGMNNIVSGLVGRKAAPTVFIETERPLLNWQDPEEKGSVAFEREGGEKTVSILASRGKDAMVIEKPEWVEVSLDDVMEGTDDYSNETRMTINVAPFNAPVQTRTEFETREGEVVVTLNGCRTLRYAVSQTRDFSGIADVTDAKQPGSVMFFNMNGQVSDEPFEGVNVKVVTFTDGSKQKTKLIR